MSAEKRPQWSSHLGFILAAAGSAVGLGSVWRFPWYTGSYGGAAFVLIYLIFMCILAIPMQWLELALGRFSGCGPVGAYSQVGNGSKWWKLAGYMALVVSLVILSFYTVVAGWTVGYIVFACGSELFDPAVNPADIFTAYTASPWQQLVSMAFFMLLSAGVVLLGVEKGIERISKYLMPVLVILMLVLIGRAVTLPQAAQGLSFYLVPDFSHVTFGTLVMAVGQAFFAMSLGVGVIMTYGSYLRKEENLPASGTQIAFFVAIVAILAGFIIFPAVGGAPEQAGPGLVFMALVDIFRQLPAGRLVAVAFFFLLAIAALTSTISLFEVVTNYFHETFNIRRRWGVLLTGVLATILGSLSALSLGAVESLSKIDFLGHTWSFLDLMDYLFANILLCCGVLLLSLFTIFVWGLKNAEAEIGINCPRFAKIKPFWRVAVAGLVPVSITFLIVYIIVTGHGL